MDSSAGSGSGGISNAVISAVRRGTDTSYQTTSYDGYYALAVPGDARYDITVTHPGYVTKHATARVGPNEMRTVDIALTSRTVVLVHGLFASATTWQQDGAHFQQTLESAGYHVLAPTLVRPYEKWVTDSGSVAKQAQALTAYVRTEVLDRGIRSVDFVCHSMGGVVVRKAIRESDTVARLARTVVMLGTPNHGSELAYLNPEPLLDYYGLRDAWIAGGRGAVAAVRDLQPGSAILKELNYNGAQGSSNVECQSHESEVGLQIGTTRYVTVAGTAFDRGVPTCEGAGVARTSLAVLLYAATECATSDGVVPASSVRLERLGDSGNFRDSDFECGAPHYTTQCHPLTASLCIAEAVISLLSGQYPANREVNLADRARGAEVPRAVVATVLDVADGVVGSRAFAVGTNDSLTVKFLGKVEGTSATVVDPNGRRIDPEVADGDPYIVYRREGNFQEYVVKEAIAGEWTAQAERPVGRDTVLLVGLEHSATIMRLMLSNDEPGVSMPEVMMVETQADAGALRGLLIIGRLRDPLGGERVVVLRDDGSGPDVVADDGTYTATVPTDVLGFYSCHLIASGTTADGRPIARELEGHYSVFERCDVAIAPGSVVFEPPVLAWETDYVTVRARVRNNGPAAAHGVVVTFVEEGVVFAQHTVSGLAAGAEVEVSGTWPARHAGRAYRFAIEASVSGAVRDRDGANNSTVRTLRTVEPVIGDWAGADALDVMGRIGAAGDGRTAVGEESEPETMGVTEGMRVQLHGTRAVVRYRLEGASAVSMGVYDVRGRRVRELVAGRVVEAGVHEMEWRGDDDRGRAVASGVYFVRLQAGDRTKVEKIVVVR